MRVSGYRRSDGTRVAGYSRKGTKKKKKSTRRRKKS